MQRRQAYEAHLKMVVTQVYHCVGLSLNSSIPGGICNSLSDLSCRSHLAIFGTMHCFPFPWKLQRLTVLVCSGLEKSAFWSDSHQCLS